MAGAGERCLFQLGLWWLVDIDDGDVSYFVVSHSTSAASVDWLLSIRGIFCLTNVARPWYLLLVWPANMKPGILS